MNWTVEETTDTEIVRNLYAKVFGEDLPAEKFRAKASRSDGTHLLLVKDVRGVSVGFGIFHGHGSEVDFWLGGIEPSHRNKGAGSALLLEAESIMRDKNYDSMTVTTYNIWADMIRMLLKRGFRIVGTRPSQHRDDVKILLRKPILIRKELRYSLTERCNFNCVFCHNEGLPREPSEGVKTDEDVLAVLAEAVRIGYSDITLTGGEPLLERDRLLFLLARLGELDPPPSMTLVTNGILIDGEVVDSLRAYPGRLKVHVSLHGSDQRTFDAVTRSRAHGAFEKVKTAIRRLTDAGITVKVNHVVLQGLNHDKVPEAVDLAFRLGAKAIKLLELLVVEENHQDYRHFYRAKAIRKSIEQIGEELERSRRRVVYSYSNHPEFRIEVEQLTCALGCIHCREVRDKTLSSDLNFHPCFVRSRAFYPVNSPSALKTAFRHGERLIDRYGYEYGESSPTLAMQERYVTCRRDAFFAVDEYSLFKKFLLEKGFRQIGSVQFAESYYRPSCAGPEWMSFRKIAKCGIDSCDQTKVEFFYIENDYAHMPDGYTQTTTKFMDPSGPAVFPAEEVLKKMLTGIGMQLFFELDWELEFLENGNLTVSLGMANGKATLRLPDPEDNYKTLKAVLERYRGAVSPLQVPLLEYVMK